MNTTRNSNRLVLLLLFLVLNGAGAVFAGVTQPVSSAYVDLYGLADDADPTVIRAKKIFRHLQEVVGHHARSSRLIVVNSPSKPWAIALSENKVVLSKGALELIYRENSLKTGDAWTAFVLGHELAHLANKDMWHHQMHTALSGSAAGESIEDLRKRLKRVSLDFDGIKDRELKADEQGFIYAALAGYHTESVLSEPSTGSFLEYWVEQTRTLADETHYPAKLRSDFLRNRLHEIKKHVHLFDYGMKLAHFGRYEDAAYLLEEFRNVFPSHQTLNNLAYVKIQLARKQMPNSLAYRFWLPTMLERESGLRVQRSLDSKLPDEARLLLEDAVGMLERANQLSPQNLVGRINLITAYFYLGDMHRARAVIEDTLPFRPKSLQLQALKALILMEQEPAVDMWPWASGIMEAIADRPGAPENVVFNYARMLSERNRHGKAKAYFARLLDQRDSVPMVYRQVICGMQDNPAGCMEGGLSTKPRVLSQPLPLEVGTDIDSKIAKKRLKNWTRISKSQGGLDFDIFVNENGDSLLAIDYKVEIVTLRNAVKHTPASIKAAHGEPDVVSPFSGKRLWSFYDGWAVVVDGKSLSEVWIAK